jgi:hypothetical protein
VLHDRYGRTDWADGKDLIVPDAIDLTGERFGMLVAVKLVRVGLERRWKCVCDCGGGTIATVGNLRSGNSKSCGCRKRAVLGESTVTHGRHGTRAYSSWQAMRTRCNNSNFHAYPRYGGRGITICARWNSFENFFADMGERPKGMSLERVDNSGNYEPNNCVWATPYTQAHNMRVNHWITYKGETMILQDWARRFGVDASTLRKQWLREGKIKCRK